MRLLPLLLVASAAAAQDMGPKLYPPDAPALAAIKKRTGELWEEVKRFEKQVPFHPFLADAAVYAKAAEWTVQLEEYYDAKSTEKLNAVLDVGFKRIEELKQKKNAEPSWMRLRGKPIVRGYKSYIDGSYQPFAITVPEGVDVRGDKWRLDIVLHGRDATLTETKFIASREAAKPGKPLPYVVLEPYGRGNLAYRWAAEREVLFELFDAAIGHYGTDQHWNGPGSMVLRGFSMGGAGTWHIGLRSMADFAAIAPGAGFTTTRGYIKLPDVLPDYVEKCLKIYDAVEYAENAFNVPVIAYSGEKDAQKKAADNVFASLAKLPGEPNAVHLVAPGLEHKQPPEWYAKVDAEIAARMDASDPSLRDRVRFVTYTPKHGGAGWVSLDKLGESYKRARVEGNWNGGEVKLTTENVTRLTVSSLKRKVVSLTVDQQTIAFQEKNKQIAVARIGGKWLADLPKTSGKEKTRGHPGPIDDAFTVTFSVIRPSRPAWSKAAETYSAAMVPQFEGEWERYFRGALPQSAKSTGESLDGSAILFGDSGSNPAIAAVLPKLPITWTQERLVVNGKTYDPQTHLPVLCYPNVHSANSRVGYTVLNSGHTFREADLKASNANLYPRLGDWAVIKPTPTKAEPWKYEVVDAGLFDEDWKFKK